MITYPRYKNKEYIDRTKFTITQYGFTNVSEPMTNWKACTAVERDPRKISGAWAFTGTRVPVYVLFENLESRGNCRRLPELVHRGKGMAGGGCSQ